MCLSRGLKQSSSNAETAESQPEQSQFHGIVPNARIQVPLGDNPQSHPAVVGRQRCDTSHSSGSRTTSEIWNRNERGDRYKTVDHDSNIT